ncbi:MAG: M50 family metallopeptidase [Symploca sp. SIO2C1]|nr:M50 family metallopeptidase [Symploca sp. SIO2C1]
MTLKEYLTQENCHDWLCPDLREYWNLARVRSSNKILLKAINGQQKFLFSPIEGYTLRYFTGQYTVRQIQKLAQQEFSDAEPNLVVNILQKLISHQILALDEPHEQTRGRGDAGTRGMETPPHNSFTPQDKTKAQEQEYTSPPATPNPQSPCLKSGVHWLHHPEGYWILRNPVAGTNRGILGQEIPILTFLQVSPKNKALIDQLPTLPSEQFRNPQVRELLQLLTATAMLVGTQPPKPRRGKFTPMQLLFFKVALFNPDPWLSKHIDKLRWLWSRPITWFLCLFLGFSLVGGFHQQLEIIYQGQQLWQHQSASLIIPFALLAAFVVTLHELGHAFTLKHYGGIVPEMGFLFMCLIPAAYTNTSDSYCLSRWQRILVVGAGVLVQVTLAAIALWLWNLSTTGSWLHTTSYLLMVASLFTVALNLNPLARFDGYYLAVAVTGINNLRSRAFSFYAHLLTAKPIKETTRDRWILATYAPFSLAYIWFVFGFLFLRITDWTLLNIPTTAFFLILIWAIYFYFPRNPSVS